MVKVSSTKKEGNLSEKVKSPQKKVTLITKTTQKGGEPNVVTDKEIGSSFGGFFSGLGFQKPVEEKKETKDIEAKNDEKNDELIVHAATKSTKKPNEGGSLPLGYGENATIIRKAAPSTERRPGPNTGYKGKPQNNRSNFAPRHQGTQSGYAQQNSNYQGKNPRHIRSVGEQSKTNEKIINKPTITKEVKAATTSSTLTKKTEIEIDKKITIKEFSEKMGVTLQDILKVMMQNGIMGGVNTPLDFDTATLVADEFNVTVKAKEQSISVEKLLTGDLQAILDLDKESSDLKERPPVVTVMGHVDHGKTSLLDYLRKSNITGGEAGGITQSIGASSVTHNGKKITFIDTPGHELFSSLRARGAKLTNIAIIVIAADDGLKPQTIESINHAKAAGVPIIIAVTKIDKIDKSNNMMEKIKSDIGNYGLIPEEWGGDVAIIGVSSKTGEGISDLLDHILLQAEVLDLKYNPNRKAVGIILDANKDQRQGITTSLIVLTGTLTVGDVIVVHNTYGKVKRMLDYQGRPLKRAVGGDPVMILGLSQIPEPGRVIEAVNSDKEAKESIMAIQSKMESEENKQTTAQHFVNQMNSEGTAVLKLVVKTDGPSSMEALQGAIRSIELPRGVELKIIHSDVGNITDSDITLAQAADAVVIGFNTKTNANMKKKAEQLKVTVKGFEIIYELIDYLKDVLNGMVEIIYKEVTIGKLDLLAVFFKKEKTMVIGGKVTEGKVTNGAQFKVMRGGEEFARGTVTSLQREQESVKEVAVGYECGMKITSKKKLEEGDVLEFYIMEEQKE